MLTTPSTTQRAFKKAPKYHQPCLSSRTCSQTSTISTQGAASMDSSERKHHLQHAKELIQSSYDLIWNDEDVRHAIDKLEEALNIQRDCLGKSHKDVGWTCNWIGSAYWKLGESEKALKYFFEARRIFCKCGQGNTKAIDQRIQCILFTHMGFGMEEVTRYHNALKKAIEHELTADRLRADGETWQAKKEYRLAKYTAASLTDLLRGDRAGI